MLLKILRLGFHLKHITHLWGNYFLGVFPTSLYSATLPSPFCCFVFFILWNLLCVGWYCDYTYHSERSIHEDFTATLWEFPVPDHSQFGCLLGRTHCHLFQLGGEARSQGICFCAAGCRPSLMFSPLTARAAFLWFSCSFSLLDRLLPHYCPDVYILLQIFLLA